MYNWYCSPTVTNCTFSKNFADSRGGGMYNGSSTPDITNCIFWDNEAGYSNDELYPDSGLDVTYCDVEGGYGDEYDNNIDADPCFADANDLAGQDGIYGTRDDGLFLRTDSNCIDAGSNAAVDEETDIIGNNRIANGDHNDNDAAIVDMGAYEVPVIWYVDGDAAGGNGKSWGNAYKDLQDALNNSDIDDGNEIWVAEANEPYKPDANDPNNRSISFELIEGVAVYGGFAGGEVSLNGRDWLSNETILSGDINEPNDANDNSYHVVEGADGAVLDGFTITGGNANSWPSDSGGGGIYCDGTSPTISNCMITGNSAYLWGGGMNCANSASPKIVRCVFNNNEADYGAGLCSYNSSLKISNCVISNNVCGVKGGGMYNTWGSPVLTNCVFTGNSAGILSGGGGMYNDSSDPILTNCTFSGNSTGSIAGDGGGMYNYRYSSPTVINCIFWGNTAVGDCNEIYNSNYADPVFGYSDIAGSGGSGDWDANLGIDLGGNIDADPCFVDASDPDGNDGVFCTSDDGLRLKDYNSPCVDAADGDAAPSRDILGFRRSKPNYVDIGAYEFASGGIVVMVWIDESYMNGGLVQYYFDAPLYEEHLNQYRNIVSSCGAVIRSGCLVPPNPDLQEQAPGIEAVLPEGYDPPEDISVETCGRPPSKNELIDDFDRICNGVVPDYLCLSVDNSGSLTTSRIQPGYGQFKDWIEENYPETVIKARDGGEFTKQAWVDEMRMQIQDVLEGL